MAISFLQKALITLLTACSAFQALRITNGIVRKLKQILIALRRSTRRSRKNSSKVMSVASCALCWSEDLAG